MASRATEEAGDTNGGGGHLAQLRETRQCTSILRYPEWAASWLLRLPPWSFFQAEPPPTTFKEFRRRAPRLSVRTMAVERNATSVPAKNCHVIACGHQSCYNFVTTRGAPRPRNPVLTGVKQRPISGGATIYSRTNENNQRDVGERIGGGHK